MKTTLKFILLIFFSFSITYGQAAAEIDLTISDNGGGSRVITFGVDPAATDGIDIALGELGLPPFPPPPAFEGRWLLPPGYSTGSYKDIRGATFPFSGTKTHRIGYQPTNAATTTQYSVAYNLPPEITGVVTDVATGGLAVNQNISGSGTLVVTNINLTALQVVFTYSNFSPAADPGFSIAPQSLDFGSLAVGLNSTLQVTVTNTGAINDLEISGVTPDNADYTVAPNPATTFPVTIAPGASYNFDVTFTPSVTGTISGNVDFAHNALGSPFSLPVTGVGAGAGPTFDLSIASLNFGTVGVGASSSQTVSVTNNGALNALSISGITVPNADYTITPNPATTFPISIPAGGSYNFNVVFAPAAGGTSGGNIEFTHNAPGSPTPLAVTGVGQAQGGDLVFAAVARERLDNTSYVDTVKLLNYVGGGLNALSFKITTNETVSDDEIVVIRNVEKGTDISAPEWNFFYELKRGGTPTEQGASQDTMIVLIYGSTLSTVLNSGDYSDLVRFTYDVVNIEDPDTQTTTFNIREAQGSLIDGNNANINNNISDPEQVVTVTNRALYGDVNNDNSVDILDLILVREHILERRFLVGGEFTRADVAPWNPANSTPSPDGVVNVQDLALLQNIILTGQYPDGTQLSKPVFTDPVLLNSLAKSDVSEDAKVTLHMTSEGIAVRLENNVPVLAMQLELENIMSVPQGMHITTTLGDGFYHHENDLLRVIAYDQSGQVYVEPGIHLIANIPVVLDNPEEVQYDRIILVNNLLEKIQNIQVEISYAQAPELPLEYALEQNYPNPFNPSTSIEFSIPEANNVSIVIYNMLGQEVRTLYAGFMERGKRTLQWDGSNDSGSKLSSGTYIYRMKAGEFVQSKKMILLK